jgi:hypothetical protein
MTYAESLEIVAGFAGLIVGGLLLHVFLDW